MKMKKYEVLTKLSNQEIKIKEAYNLLYGEIKEVKPKRASFVKLKIVIPDEKKATFFLAVLFALPIPIFILKLVMSKKMNQVVNDQFPITYKELFDLVAVKGVKLKVNAKSNEQILIRTI
jgi:hypothetical protein